MVNGHEFGQRYSRNLRGGRYNGNIYGRTVAGNNRGLIKCSTWIWVHLPVSGDRETHTFKKLRLYIRIAQAQINLVYWM